jgi:hypothetical protein
MWKAGAALSAVLATAVPGMARTKMNNDTNLKTKIDRLTKQVGMLEDENTIRSLHKTYENNLDNGKYEEVVNLFTNDAEVIFNGGVFKGKNRGVHRLYTEHFSAGLTGKKIAPAPGFQPDTEQQQDIIEVSPDSRAARARFTYSIQVGTPMNMDSTLVRMARLQGEGIIKWWEGGTYEVSYVKDIKGDKWKIKRLEYRVLSKTDYKPGKSYARPISVPPFSKAYPEDPAGPDRLIAILQGSSKA